jgi:hypothetical protein
MPSDIHIFASAGEQTFTVRHPGFEEAREFPSLGDATLHLRNLARENSDWIVIHDGEGHSNRIPLHPEL